MGNLEINFVERQIMDLVEEMRPDETIRKELDIGYTFENNTLEIFEIRPMWNDKSKIMKLEFAKSRYIKSKDLWKIYWMRASGKWELYPSEPEVKSILEVFRVINEDELACFKG